MPAFPHLDSKADALGGSVFSALAGRIAALQGEVYRFHIGDTWMEPPEAVRFTRVPEGVDPAPHRYANPAGLSPLLDALVAKLRDQNQLSLGGPGQILVTPGATGALSVACQSALSPGDEVLVLAPYWPLIRGIVALAGAKVVEVAALHADVSPEALREALAARLTHRTAAIYVSTPCNPTGRVLDSGILDAVAGFARDQGLWVLSDEVYEDYVYDGEHVSIGRMAPDHTLSAFSFSKAYGMTGHRVGYLAGPAAVIAHARKVGTYSWYSVTTAAQYLALQALAEGDAWRANAKDAYHRAGQAAAVALGLDEPAGSTFLFFDATRALDARGVAGFLEDCLDDNLVLAPGSSFGAGFGNWLRLCFTSMPPDVTARGIARLAARLKRAKG